MPPKKQRVWAYGRHKQRTIKNDCDDWLSLAAITVKPVPVFSSPDSEHSSNSDEMHIDDPIGRLLSEPLQRQSPLLDEILATPEVVQAKKKARTLAEETPELAVIQQLRGANDKFMITARRRACSPVSSLCFSDSSNLSVNLSNVKPVISEKVRQTQKDKENRPASDEEVKTRQFTKLSRKCKNVARTRRSVPKQEERIALDLSEIEKIELEVTESLPSGVGILRSAKKSIATERTFETPPLITLAASKSCKDSAYDSNDASTPVVGDGTSGVLKREQTSTPYQPDTEQQELQDECDSRKDTGIDCSNVTPAGLSQSGTPSNMVSVKPCSVSLERIPAHNLSSLSQQSQNKLSHRSSADRSSTGSCRNCFVRLEPLTPGSLERLTKRRSSSDEEIENIAQDISMLGINSNGEEENDDVMDDNSCHSDEMDDSCHSTEGDSDIGIKGHQDKLIQEFLNSGSENSFHGFPSVVTPAKRAVRSLLKAESFKEALTPVKQRKEKQISPREKVLLQCGQTQPISFSKCIPRSVLQKCKKIGEGTFGEVFRTQNHRHSVALKIIPIEGDFSVNDEPQKSFEDILPEIVISKELSDLNDCPTNMACNFIQVNDVSLVKGQYPKHLLKEWDKFNQEHESENDRPDMFDSSQLFIIFEFADGGSDLEHFKFNNILQAHSVLHQVTCALAVAERELMFEHRDLHWGNILVKYTDEETLFYKLDGRVIEIPTNGVEVNIIDFTMSRLQKDGCTVFCNLATDETLFQGEGDYQFEVYRLMKKYNSNNWEKNCPATNVLWLHYLTDKLLKNKKYKSTKQLKSIQKQFRAFFKNGLIYSSAEDVLINSDLFQT